MNYANATITFKDEPDDDLDVIIKLSCDGNEDDVEDEFIFYYCNGEHCVQALMDEDNCEDFFVRSYSLVDSPWG